MEYGSIIGDIPILDEMYLDLDFTIHSLPIDSWGNILQCGSINEDRYPAIYILPEEGINGNTGLMATVQDGKNVTVNGQWTNEALILNQLYHIHVEFTQNRMTVKLNDEIIFDADKSSHSVQPSVPCYASYPCCNGAAAAPKVTISNLIISTTSTLFPTSAPTQTPTKDPTNPTKEPTASPTPPTTWIPIAKNACFSATTFLSNYTFEAQYSGNVTAVHLRHVSGSVMCANDGGTPTHWGCSDVIKELNVQLLRHETNGSRYTVLPTNDTNNISFIDDESCSNGCSVRRYSMDGYDPLSAILTWRDLAADFVVSQNDTFSLQYWEGCCGIHIEDNAGISCADVYFEYGTIPKELLQMWTLHHEGYPVFEDFRWRC